MNNQHHSVMINMPQRYGQSFRKEAALNGIFGSRFSFDDLVISTFKKHLGHYAIQKMKMIMEKTPKKYSDNLFIFPTPATEILCKIKTIFQLTTTISLSKITRNEIYI